MRIPCLVSAVVLGLPLAACTTSDTNVPDESEDSGTDPETDVTNSPDEGVVELTPELCDDPSNLQTIVDSLGDEGSLGGFGSLNVNEDELPKLLASPTTPFYMVNLITYRERAVYPDGRETDLTGREANALYDPFPFITAIGGRVVYNASVDNQIAGTEDVTWDEVAIVEYSCPIAFLAMMSDPGFQETSIHKDAGVEVTRVMFAELQPLPAPEDPDQSEAVYPPTTEDPAFDLVHVMDFHDIAQYEPDANEPERSGEEAWNLYQSGATGVSGALGHYSTAFFEVTGTLIGENPGWDEIQMVHVSSLEGFQALLDNDTRQGVRYHRTASLADNDSMILYPDISAIPYAELGTTPPELTPNGTGTICQEDADCPDDTFICLSDGGASGFCSPEGCTSGSCEGSYVCCHDCNPALAAQLPFEGSVCMPDGLSAGLTNAPVSCTCD